MNVKVHQLYTFKYLLFFLYEILVTWSNVNFVFRYLVNCNNVNYVVQFSQGIRKIMQPLWLSWFST